MKRAELRARLVFLVEALEDGDTSTALAVAQDLVSDLGGPVRGTARCRFCGLTDWPGVIKRHEGVVHPHELLDLEERAA